MSNMSSAIILLLAAMPMAYFFLRHLQFLKKQPSSDDDQTTRRQRRWRGSVAVGCALTLVTLFALVPNPAPDTLPFQTINPGVTTSAIDLTNVHALGDDSWRAVQPLTLRSMALKEVRYWFKVELPAAATDQEYVAEMRFPLYTKFAFGLYRDGQLIDRSVFGRTASGQAARRGGVLPHYEFTAEAGHKTTLYMAFEGSGLVVLPITVREESVEEQLSLRDILLSGLAMGCFLGILLYNLSLSVALRDILYLQYAGYQSAFLAFIMTYKGTLPAILGPIQQDQRITTYLLCFFLDLQILTFIPFHIRFLDAKRRFPHIRRLLFSGWLLTILVLALLPTLDMTGKFFSEMFLLTLFFVTTIGSLWSQINHKYVFNFLMGFIGLLVCVSMHVLAITNVIGSNFLTDQMLYIGTLWNGIFASLAISDRIAVMQKERRSLLDSFACDAPSGSMRDPAALPSAEMMQVAIVFIDVANFAIIADILGSAAVYRRLAGQINRMRRIIARHHGSIDRSLGDGLLCFFVDRGGEGHRGYINNAFQAAIEIQKMTLKVLGSHNGRSQMLMPLRIGLHVDDVLVGNLGSPGRVDYTMIGKGVNLAHHLEAACSPFKIMASREFCAKLEAMEQSAQGFNEIHISCDQQEALLKAYEYNPFVGEAGLLDAAERGFAQSLGINKRETRVRLPELGECVQLISSYGTFLVSDLSPNGFGVLSDVFIGRKAVIAVGIKVPDRASTEVLRSSHLDTIQVEVRWCRDKGGKFEHGLKIVGLNQEQKQVLFTVLSSSLKEQASSEPVLDGQQQRRA